MLKNQIHRTLPTSPAQQSFVRMSGALCWTRLAIAAIAALWSISASSPAAELRPMVVVGIPANSVALSHPTPEYPRDALNLHISGDVLVRVQVENGIVTETTVISHSSPLLGASATHWLANEWKFKPSVSGVFTVPISYKQSA
jgi:outer membrane biosynthesis protein TonB